LPSKSDSNFKKWSFFSSFWIKKGVSQKGVHFFPTPFHPQISNGRQNMDKNVKLPPPPSAQHGSASSDVKLESVDIIKHCVLSIQLLHYKMSIAPGLS